MSTFISGIASIGWSRKYAITIRITAYSINSSPLSYHMPHN